MLAQAAVAIGVMAAAPGGPAACAAGERCHETWRATIDGIEIRVVERMTADAHAADREAYETIYVRSASGWLEAHAWWMANDVEMSTASRTRVARRHARIGALDEGRPVVVVQIDLVETVVDRGPDRRSTGSRRALVLACAIDGASPACTAPVPLRCGARCDVAVVRDGALRWHDLDGDHREPLAF